MPMSKADRIARKLNHTKQERLQISNGVPSLTDLRAGVPVLRSTNEGMVEYIKHNNTLYKKVLDRDVVEPRSVTTTKSLGTKAIFQAHVSSKQDLADSTEVLVDVDTVDFDTMSSFGKTANLYTISVSGIYFLYYSVAFRYVDTSMDELRVYLKNSAGDRFAICVMDGEELRVDSDVVTRNGHAIRHLNAGDTVGLYCYIDDDGGTDIKENNDSASGGQETFFGGFLLTEPKAVRKVEQQAGEETVAPDSPL